MIAISHGLNEAEAFSNLLDVDKGIIDIFEKYDTVILKPNFVMPKKYAITSIELIEQICKLAEIYGTKLEVIESPGMEFNPATLESYTNIKKLEKKYNLRTCLKPNAFFRVDIKGVHLKKIYIIADFLEKPWINIFKIKTHVISTVTLGAKNLMGILRYDTRQDMHITGVNKCLLDIANFIKPNYSLADGFPAMEGDGPTFGMPRWDNIMLGSDNILKLDHFIAKEIMKINMGKIDYLKDVDVNYNEIKGCIGIIPNIKPFKEPSVSDLYLKLYNGMYSIDKIFYPLFKLHFNEFLYSFSIFGTKVVIKNKISLKNLKDKDFCKFDAINFEKGEINYKKCVNCMDCVEQYPNIFAMISIRDRINFLRYRSSKKWHNHSRI